MNVHVRHCSAVLFFFIFSMVSHCDSIHYWRLPGLVLSPSTGRYDGPASTYVRLLRFSRFFFFSLGLGIYSSATAGTLSLILAPGK